MHLKSILLFRQMGLLELLGKPYLAGHSLDEGIEAIEQLFLQGLQEHSQPICSTLDILGEEAGTRTDTEKNILLYQNALEALGRLRVAHLPTANEHGIRSPFTASLKLLHPFMPFVTEEIWSHLPHKETELLMVASWPHN